MVVQHLSASGWPSRISKSWLFLPFFVCLSVQFTTCLYFLNKEPVSWGVKTESEVNVCRGERGELSPWLTGACFLPVGLGCLRAPQSPGGHAFLPACSGEDRLLIWGGACLSLSLIHQLLPEPFWVAVPGRRRQFWEQKESMRGERELCRGNRIPGDSLFLIIMAIF